MEELGDPNRVWEDDKVAVCCIQHVAGNRYMPMGVLVTKNWSTEGLQKLHDHHLKVASESTPNHEFFRFYRGLKEEPELWTVRKLASYLTVQSCVEHMGMMYRWETEKPVFLVPNSQMKRIRKYIE